MRRISDGARKLIRLTLVKPSEFYLWYLDHAKEKHWSELYDPSAFWKHFLQLASVFLFGLSAIWGIGSLLPAGFMGLKEIAAPLILSLPFVCILLASRTVLLPGSAIKPGFPWSRTAVLVIISFLLIVSATPAIFPHRRSVHRVDRWQDLEFLSISGAKQL